VELIERLKKKLLAEYFCDGDSKAKTLFLFPFLVFLESEDRS